MPEMPDLLKSVCTSRTYCAVAGRVVLPWALQGLHPSGLGLEIGAGSGAMAARLLARCPDLALVVTDYDPQMVTCARATLTRFGERAVVTRADAAELPFDDARFDVVASFGMLHHVGGWERAIAEAVRVLRPGGRLVGYDVLDTAPVRWAHRVGVTGPSTTLAAGRLETELAGRPVTEIRTRRAAGGTLVRFIATKAAVTLRAPAGQSILRPARDRGRR